MSRPLNSLLLKIASLVFILTLPAACSPVAGSLNLPTSTPCATSEANGEIKICSSSEPAATQMALTVTDVPQVGPQPAFLPGPTELPPSPTAPPPAPTLLPSPTAVPTLTPCTSDVCTFSASLFLSRPIASTNNPRVDPTYRFGSTLSGQKEPHHGVEFPNPFGTPVLSAGDGVVVVAGDDLQPTSLRGVWPITYFGPYSNFYGKLVIIEHTAPAALAQLFPDLAQPVYSLYAHLSEISVQVGEAVTAGQQIGKVGMSGIAEGPHLHFEIRLGAETYTSYKSSHNPELWLMPNPDENGQPLCALAVRFIDPYGGYIEVPGISLEHLPAGPDQPSDLQIHLITYEEKILRGQTPFQESLGINDLPPGWYRINYPRGGMQKVLVEVLSGQLTLITIRLR
jgi:murein DD-endopeptidase MepM/ murein hydrolase activator NlpD